MLATASPPRSRSFSRSNTGRPSASGVACKCMHVATAFVRQRFTVVSVAGHPSFRVPIARKPPFPPTPPCTSRKIANSAAVGFSSQNLFRISAPRCKRLTIPISAFLFVALLFAGVSGALAPRAFLGGRLRVFQASGSHTFSVQVATAKSHLRKSDASFPLWMLSHGFTLLSQPEWIVLAESSSQHESGSIKLVAGRGFGRAPPLCS